MDAPGKGLTGRLDAPEEAVAPGRGFLVGGWVVHERHEVTSVLVTANGRVVARAVVDGHRPDVQDRYPDVPGAERRGWTVEVEPFAPESDVLTIRAYALVDSADDDAKRLGPWIRFAEREVRVERRGDRFGVIDEIDELPVGAARVTGAAWAPGGLARVELTSGDGEWVRARHSVPGTAVGASLGADSGLDGFVGYVDVPGRMDQVAIRAVAVGLDGHRHELESAVVSVLPADDQPVTAARLSDLRERFDRRVALLRAGTQRPPRVLVATHSLGVGGAQLYLSLLLDRLTARGLDVCVVSRQDGPLRDDLEQAGVPVLVVGDDLGGREALEGQLLEIASFAVENGARACLANALPAFPAVAAAKRLGLPTTWVIHESFRLGMFWHEAYGRLLPDDVVEVATDALGAADEVVFVAEATSRLYDGLVPAERRAVVRYGVEAPPPDVAAAEEARRSLGIDPDALVLACVGTVEPRKGQLALVRAFARIPAEQRRGAHLLVVGMSDTPYAQALRHHVEASGLSGSVSLVDVTPDVYPLYAASDVLVSASDIESLPRTMLEAMLVGRPVASTSVFGVPELVVDGHNGFLCEPLDLGALQGMLERVIATPRPRLSEMGEAARASVAEAHDPASYVEHFWGRLSRWVAESAD